MHNKINYRIYSVPGEAINKCTQVMSLNGIIYHVRYP